MPPRFSLSLRPRLRSRLVHTLSLWLLGAVCASVLAMGGFTAWNLRQGFSAYLQARDLERLDLLAQVLVQDIGRSGSAQAWLAQPLNLRALLRQHATLDGVVTPATAPSAALPPPGAHPDPRETWPPPGLARGERGPRPFEAPGNRPGNQPPPGRAGADDGPDQLRGPPPPLPLSLSNAPAEAPPGAPAHAPPNVPSNGPFNAPPNAPPATTTALARAWRCTCPAPSAGWARRL